MYLKLQQIFNTIYFLNIAKNYFFTRKFSYFKFLIKQEKLVVFNNKIIKLHYKTISDSLHLLFTFPKFIISKKILKKKKIKCHILYNIFFEYKRLFLKNKPKIVEFNFQKIRGFHTILRKLLQNYYQLLTLRNFFSIFYIGITKRTAKLNIIPEEKFLLGFDLQLKNFLNKLNLFSFQKSIKYYILQGYCFINNTVIHNPQYIIKLGDHLHISLFLYIFNFLRKIYFNKIYNFNILHLKYSFQNKQKNYLLTKKNNYINNLISTNKNTLARNYYPFYYNVKKFFLPFFIFLQKIKQKKKKINYLKKFNKTFNIYKKKIFIINYFNRRYLINFNKNKIKQINSFKLTIYKKNLKLKNKKFLHFLKRYRWKFFNKKYFKKNYKFLLKNKISFKNTKINNLFNKRLNKPFVLYRKKYKFVEKKIYKEKKIKNSFLKLKQIKLYYPIHINYKILHIKKKKIRNILITLISKQFKKRKINYLKQTYLSYKLNNKKYNSNQKQKIKFLKNSINLPKNHLQKSLFFRKIQMRNFIFSPKINSKYKFPYFSNLFLLRKLNNIPLFFEFSTKIFYGIIFRKPNFSDFYLFGNKFSIKKKLWQYFQQNIYFFLKKFKLLYNQHLKLFFNFQNKYTKILIFNFIFSRFFSEFTFKLPWF
jgi:hypothetical protein